MANMPKQYLLKTYTLTKAMVLLVLLNLTIGTKAFASTATLSSFDVPEGAPSLHSIALGSDGNMWFTSRGSNLTIGRINPGGDIDLFQNGSTASPTFDIALGSDGNMWFTIQAANKIGRITPEGTITEYSIPTNGAYPYDIALGSDGNIWFTEFASNKVAKITPSGTITEYTLTTPNSGPQGITLGPDGNIWVAQATDRVSKITPSGTITEYWLGDQTNSLYPTDLALGPDDNLYVTNLNNKIIKINENGIFSEIEISGDTVGATKITSGPDSSLWITDPGATDQSLFAQVIQLRMDGSTEYYPVQTRISRPVGITYDSNGNLWFVEYYDQQISRLSFSPNSTLTPNTPSNDQIPKAPRSGALTVLAVIFPASLLLGSILATRSHINKAGRSKSSTH